MKKFDCVLVISHLAYRKTPPLDPVEGPYSSVCRALSLIIGNVSVLGIPLTGYRNEVIFGVWGSTKKIKVPDFLGKWLLIKFLTDMILNVVVLIWWSLLNWNKKKLVVGIDPLSCLPLWPLKVFLNYSLIFHCVDFNKNRFENKVVQKAYELADEWSSRFSDQTWVICESLANYKRKQYGIKSHYVPNSVIFEPKIYDAGKNKRTGNKMIWTGGLMTNRQYDILFGVFSHIQTKVRPDIEFVIAPTRDYDRFEEYVKKYKIKKTKILRLTSRLEFQKVAATCDVGIALYDEQFGSTEFIEPMKIWDFLLCGLPFVVSSEPSIAKPIVRSGVVYFMKPKNQIPNNLTLKLFLSKRRLMSKAGICLSIAKRFDIEKQIRKRLGVLSL